MMLDRELEEHLKREAREIARAEAAKVVQTYEHVKAQMGKDTRLDNVLDTGAHKIAEKWKAFAWLARLFDRWSAGQQLLLVGLFFLIIIAVICAVAWFTGSRKDSQYAAQIQALKAEQQVHVDTGAAKEAESAVSLEDYRQLANLAQSQAGRLSEYEKALAVQSSVREKARTVYVVSTTEPVAKITPDGKTMEQYLKDVTDGAKKVLSDK